MDKHISDNESFVRLIQLAWDDEDIRTELVKILKLDSFNRTSLLNTYIDKMRLQGLPEDFINTLGYLRDDDIANQVFQAIQSK